MNQGIFAEFVYQINETVMRIQCSPNTPISEARELIDKFKETLDLIEERAKADAVPVDPAPEQKEGE